MKEIVSRRTALPELLRKWNAATVPYVSRTEREHKRNSVYARSLMNRIHRLGFVQGRDYRELSNGSLWPNDGAR